MTDSQRLLAEYVQTGSDAAFRELVTRYVGLVFSTARRLVDGDTHRAEDVAQIVFVDLARTARTLPGDLQLGGWLHRHTCFVAAKTMRGERRRQSRERQAVEMNALQNNSEADYSFVAPVLDEAINELDEADRTAILLRFFEQHDFRSVGEALGANEDTARMRVNRALDKLQGLIKRRGVTTSAAALSVVLSANAVQAAPVGLAVTIATALAGITIATTATATATKAIAMTTLQKTIVTATITVLAGAGIYEARQASHLREQVHMLQQEQATLAEQAKQSEEENSTRANQLVSADENQKTNNSNELLRLRAEVARLRRESDELSAAAKDAQAFQESVLAVLSNTPPVRTLVATSTANVPWEESLVLGGWKTPGGKRAIVLATVERGDTPQGVSIATTVLEYPESNAATLGLSKFNTDDTLPTRGYTLNSEQTKELIKLAESSEGGLQASRMRITTASGNQAQIQSVNTHQTPSGQKYSTGPVLDVLPVVSADGQSVQVVMTAQLNYPIPFLKR